jgi:hypothetical protein
MLYEKLNSVWHERALNLFMVELRILARRRAGQSDLYPKHASISCSILLKSKVAREASEEY